MSKHIRPPMLLARLYHIFFKLGYNNTTPPTKQYLKNILQQGASVWNEWRESHPGEELDLSDMDLSRILLDNFNMQNVHLERAHLEEASLNETDLRRAYLSDAHLEKANLQRAHLEGAYLERANLDGANLREVFFDNTTRLDDITLGSMEYGYACLADVYWNDVNLGVINWTSLPMLGEEHHTQLDDISHSQTKPREVKLRSYQIAVRANRQVAVALRTQGMNEEAAYYAYRAQVLQQHILGLPDFSGEKKVGNQLLCCS